jgi:hypothetical protein
MIIKNNPDAFDELMFGDYCADSAKFRFNTKKSKRKIIRHYRYCTPESWLIVRGKEDVSYEQSMKEVSQKIVDSGQFAGRDFSSADEYIYDCAKGDKGPGGASTWREINTAHHITQVVSDIGKIKGFSISKRHVTEKLRQLSLLDENI